LEANPARRIQTAPELLRELQTTERRWARRRSRWITAAIAAGILLAAGATWLWLRPDRPPPGPEQWVQLTRVPDSVSQPALSPDGRNLTFVRGPNTFAGAGQIYIKALPDGEARQLTHDNLLKMSPVFSPDGSSIAYSTADRQNRWDIWSIPASGGEPNLWLRNAGGLTWFRAHEILFSEIQDHNVHMAIVASSDTRTAAMNVYLPAEPAGMAHRSYASPDGKWVLLVEMDAKAAWLPCRLVPMDGSSPGRAVGPPGAGCTFATWSPDGKWMYMSANTGSAFHTWRQRFPDGKPEQITFGPTEEEGIAMARDGRSFITAVALRQSALWLHEFDDERQLATEGYSYDPKFAARGKKLCYRTVKGNSPRTELSELWILDAASGLSERLLPGIQSIGGQGAVYDVSADGEEIVSGGSDRDGKQRLWIARIDRSSPPQQIPNVEGDQPLFMKNGQILLHANGNLLHRVRRDGTGLTKLMNEPVLYRGTLSPDEKWIPVRRIGAGGYYGELFSLEGRAPIQIAPPGAVDFYLSWSPDGKNAFLSVSLSVNSDRGRTYIVPLAHGKMLPAIPAGGFRTETEIAALPGAHRIDSLDVTPGPRPGGYAFARETSLRNLYRIPIP
jgi:Tol biopolymer transport system component